MNWHASLGRVPMPDGRVLIGASFRGVPYFVEEAQRGGGRRGPDHEYPNEDVPYGEDTGRKQRVIQDTAYLVGSTCLEDARRLERALEDVKGPGELRHPYHGKRRVICRNFQRTDRSTEGRMVRFAITYHETPDESPFPSAVVDRVASLKSKAATAMETTRRAYVESYNATALPGDFLTSAERIIRDAGRAMNDPYGRLLTQARDLAAFRRRVNRLINNAANLVRRPVDVFDAIFDALAFAFAPPTLPQAFRDLLNMGKVNHARLPTPPKMTPNREREAANFRVTAAMLRRVNTIRTSEIAGGAPFPDFELARLARAQLIERIDEELESADDDEVYTTFVDLKDAVRETIPGEDARLPLRLVITPSVTIPSLVFAHRVYGDVERELEIVTRNRVAHPGFLVGGYPLEVLSDGDA